MQEKSPGNLGWLIPFLLIALLAYFVFDDEKLKVDRAQSGGISLQLAAEPPRALEVMKAWSPREQRPDRIHVARTQICWDFLLAALYAFGLFKAVRKAAFAFEPADKERVCKFAWAPVVAAALDAGLENPGMLWMLRTPGELPSIWISGTVATAAWLKWLLLLGTFALLISAAIINVFRSRRLIAEQKPEALSNLPLEASPAQVLHLELNLISKGRPNRIPPMPGDAHPTDDRAAWKRAYDAGLIGLALSGGGIRSATFSLGVLQALAKRGMLSRIDYVSTVSGGGYIGSWLSAWVRRAKGGITEVEKALSQEDVVSRPIEFLRTYSNYLTPRTGIFGVDTWTAIATWVRNFSVNLLILVAFVWSALALLMFGTKALSLSAFVLGVYAALLLWIAIGLLTFGVALRVKRSTPVWGKLTSARAVKYGVIGSLGLASIGGGFWWALGGVDWEQALSGPFAIVIPVGLIVTLLALCKSAMINRANTKRRNPIPTVGVRRTVLRSVFALLACKSWPFGLTARRTILWFVRALFSTALRTMLRYVCALLAGIFLVLATIRSGSPVVLQIGNILFETKAGTSMDPNLYIATVMMFFPPLCIAAMLVGVYVAIYILGSAYGDKGREWWARLGGSFSLMILFWLAIVGSSFVIPGLVHWLGSSDAGKLNLTYVLGALWAAITAITGLAARSGPSTSAGASVKALIIRVGPYIAAIGFYVIAAYWFFDRMCAWSGVPDLWSKAGSSPAGHIRVGALMLMSVSATYYFWMAVAFAVVSLVFALCADINLFSLRDFYKNRLVRAYLGATNQKRFDDADDFTGFSPSDDLRLWDLRCNGRPYHLVNTSLNLVHSSRLAWQERKAASFLFSPLYCGYSLPYPEGGDLDINYRSTRIYADDHIEEGGIMLGEAMALSGAALSPNRGQGSTPILTLLMTLLNVRLGGWLPNPRYNERYSSPLIAGAYLFKELFGLTTEYTRYVNVSDGGHFDNLGVYELVRRRCRLIIVSDATEDTGRVFEDLGGCIRKCRLDFNVQIELDVRPLIPGTDRISKGSCAVGTIRYPDFGAGAMTGVILYLKASITEPVRHSASLLSYFRLQGVFPHHSTANQWFGESIFESYRALGEELAESLCSNNRGALGIP